MKDNYITLTMVSDGHTKTFAIPRGRLEIEAMQNRKATNLKVRIKKLRMTSMGSYTRT